MFPASFDYTGFIEDDKGDAFFSFHHRFDVENAAQYHRFVLAKAEKQGIGSELMRMTESWACVVGAESLIVEGVSTQRNTIDAFSKRGYSQRSGGGGLELFRRLPEAPPECDLSRYHRFQTQPTGRRKYHVETII
jgi:GNAT superfamily N-acetyltransferase